MAIEKIILAGFGGQGVLLIGQMLAYAAMYENKEVTWMPSYGPEMRGGTANCSVIISDSKKISSPIVTEATTVLAMNGPSLQKFEKDVVAGGKLFINASLIDEKSTRTDIDVYYVDCNEKATALGNPKVANIVALGALLKETGIVKPETIVKVMEKTFTGSKAALLDLNKLALSAY